MGLKKADIEKDGIRVWNLDNESWLYEHPFGNCQIATMSYFNSVIGGGPASLKQDLIDIKKTVNKNILMIDISIEWGVKLRKYITDSNINVSILYNMPYKNLTGSNMEIIMLDLQKL